MSLTCCLFTNFFSYLFITSKKKSCVRNIVFYRLVCRSKVSSRQGCSGKKNRGNVYAIGIVYIPESIRHSYGGYTVLSRRYIAYQLFQILVHTEWSSTDCTLTIKFYSAELFSVWSKAQIKMHIYT